jgi:hypothetical protein
MEHQGMRKNELRKWRENYTPFAGECLAEGVRLNVHFEEKEYVKDLGAKWHPDSSGKGGYWWMPVRQLSRQPDSQYTPSVVNIFEAGESDTGGCSNGITILQWLDDNKMLSGDWHGDLDKEACDEVCIGETPKEYSLVLKDATMKFDFYNDLQIVRFTITEPHGTGSPNTRESSVWHVADDARELWDSMVGMGAVRTEVAV